MGVVIMAMWLCSAIVFDFFLLVNMLFFFPFWGLEKNFGELEARKETENTELVSSPEDVPRASNP